MYYNNLRNLLNWFGLSDYNNWIDNFTFIRKTTDNISIWVRVDENKVCVDLRKTTIFLQHSDVNQFWITAIDKAQQVWCNVHVSPMYLNLQLQSTLYQVADGDRRRGLLYLNFLINGHLVVLYIMAGEFGYCKADLKQ